MRVQTFVLNRRYYLIPAGARPSLAESYSLPLASFAVGLSQRRLWSVRSVGSTPCTSAGACSVQFYSQSRCSKLLRSSLQGPNISSRTPINWSFAEAQSFNFYSEDLPRNWRKAGARSPELGWAVLAWRSTGWPNTETAKLLHQTLNALIIDKRGKHRYLKEKQTRHN